MADLPAHTLFLFSMRLYFWVLPSVQITWARSQLLLPVISIEVFCSVGIKPIQFFFPISI